MLEFTKMQGAGNDFIVFDGMARTLPEYGLLARAVCSRRFGIGADGILVARASDDADLAMVYYNADGSRAAMCGNGMRCFAKFARENGLTAKNVFTVETPDGVKKVRTVVSGEGVVTRVTVDMGRPVFLPYELPVLLPGERIADRPLEAAGRRLRVTCVRVGVPHTVIFVPALSRAEVETVGPAVERHPAFPSGTNVDFVEVTGRDRLKIATWERGAGHTLACGTGCCAAAVAARTGGRVTGDRVRLDTEGGPLQVGFLPDGSVRLTGGAETICTGVLSPGLLCRRPRP